MAFPQVENLYADSIAPRSWAPRGLTPGARIRVLLEDPDNGAMTAIIDLPRGWEMPPAACNTDQEFLLLQGEMLCGQQSMKPGAYSYYPPGEVQSTRRVLSDASIFAMYKAAPSFERREPQDTPGAKVIDHIDTWAIPWQDPRKVSDPSEAFRPGVMVKILRIDARSGEQTYLAGLMAGWYMAGIENHGFEENYCLSGDVHIGEVAGEAGYTMTAGCYMARPAGIPHGPIVSKNGNVNLVHVPGRMVINYTEHPQGESMVRHHLESFPWR